MLEKSFPEVVAANSMLKEVLDYNNKGQAVYCTKLPDGAVVTYDWDIIVVA